MLLLSRRPLLPSSSSSSPNTFRSLSISLPRSAKSASKPRKDPVSQYYSSTLNLPKTSFPLRAEAVKREKLFWKRSNENLYEWQSKQTDRELFVLHDGPPYANGNLHCGHALNKITKDIINRSKLIQGFKIHYVPGFDTHGLPLELKALSSLNKPVSKLSSIEIRDQARKEAEKGIELQTKEFKSFSIMGDWNKSYKTMDWEYEKRQLEIVQKMVEKGLIVSNNRPTLYSPSSKTALAEAELEYREDHVSRSVYVKFPIHSLGPGLETAFEAMKLDLDLGNNDMKKEKKEISLVCWTTTPWTLPSNLAIAVSPTMEYSLVKSNEEYLIVATERIEALSELFQTRLEPVARFLGTSLLSTSYTSVLNSSSSTSTTSTQSPIRPIIPASYVTSTTGTGLVHTSPAHGIEDFESYRKFQSTLSSNSSSSPFYNREIVCAVDEQGNLIRENLLKFGLEETVVDRLQGKQVLGNAVEQVVELLKENGRLLKEVKVVHKFPYDWRSKQPVIYRASNQWFANLEKVKTDAISALSKVSFYPSRGSKTLEMYIKGRSEWCISRQRAWGVPIPVIYYQKQDGGDSVPLMTRESIEWIVRVLEKNGGSDYWWKGKVEEFIEPKELEKIKKESENNGKTEVSFRKGTDTLDVWFDSGCSWTLLQQQQQQQQGLGLENREGVLADVYFEGSDQHRGWFQSSLLTKIASTRPGEVPVAPYKEVITHGMVLDDKGRKMSKSLGNVISPDTVIKGGKNLKLEPAYGTDLLRIWVASVDSSRDVLIGPGILAQTFDGFRKIRNTARFLLGNLSSTTTTSTSLEREEELDVKSLGLIERYILHELYNLDQTAREAFSSYQFNRAYQALSNFSNSTLSAFWFDVTKDTLYADSKNSLNRRKVVYTLQKVFDTYLSILSPLAPLLAEEIYHYSKGATKDPASEDEPASSVFERIWKKPDPEWNDVTVKNEMDELLSLRTQVQGLLEEARNDKKIGSSAEARVVLVSPSETVRKHLDVLKTLFIVSDVSIEEQTSSSSSSDSVWKYSSSDSASSSTQAIVLPAIHSKCPRCWQFTVDASSSATATPPSLPIDIVTETPSPPVCNRCAQALGPEEN
ncbi:hypothetical protein JCM5350_007903 [Sporobolomyces pararoseus]